MKKITFVLALLSVCSAVMHAMDQESFQKLHTRNKNIKREVDAENRLKNWLKAPKKNPDSITLDILEEVYQKEKDTLIKPEKLNVWGIFQGKEPSITAILLENTIRGYIKKIKLEDRLYNPEKLDTKLATLYSSKYFQMLPGYKKNSLESLHEVSQEEDLAQIEMKNKNVTRCCLSVVIITAFYTYMYS